MIFFLKCKRTWSTCLQTLDVHFESIFLLLSILFHFQLYKVCKHSLLYVSFQISKRLQQFLLFSKWWTLGFQKDLHVSSGCILNCKFKHILSTWPSLSQPLGFPPLTPHPFPNIGAAPGEFHGWSPAPLLLNFPQTSSISFSMVLSDTKVKFVNQALLPAAWEHPFDPLVQLVEGIFTSFLHRLGLISGVQSDVDVQGGG